MEKQKDAVVAARVSQTLKQLIQKYIAQDTHMNESELIRDAVRQKIQKEAPDLYRQLFKEVKT